MRADPRARGSTLLEALIAILIFSVGVLGIAGLQGFAIGAMRDTGYRSEASYLANQFVGLMWMHVDRRTPEATLDTFCAFALGTAPATGCPATVSGSADITRAKAEWLARVSAALPNASAAAQSVALDATDGRRVTVTLSWRAPQDAATRRHVVTASVN